MDLADVTLLAADTANHALALRALRRSMEGIRFGRVMLLTDAMPMGLDVPADIDVVPIAPIGSRDAYSLLMLKSLLPHVTTSHVLVVQWDGYVVNADAWEPGFLDCDYLGAKWFWHKDGMNVGNGGFSLRSRKLLAALADPAIGGDGAEDELICRKFRPLLERDHGIRFGHEATADRFAFEAMYPAGMPFGFHGLYNFVRVMKQAELASVATQFSDAIAGSPQCLQLLHNARALAQWQAVDALATRMLAAHPDHAEALAVRAEARRRDSPHSGVARNDPCPCGSGKRFKHCHGRETTIATAAAASSGVDALTRRGMAAHQRGDLDAAARDYREALAIDADAAHAAHYLGVIHYQRGEFDAALPLIERSVAQVGDEAEFHNNAGLLYAAVDRVDDAVEAYRNALARRPDHATAWNNLGLALTQRNDLDGASDAYRLALTVNPDFAEARWNLALALLARGDFAEGWRHYDARLALPALSDGERRVSGPRYDGQPLQGRTLLLAAEQGLGDTLQFIRFARDFAARGARVIAQVPEPLMHLCATAAGVAEVLASADPLPAYDFQLPLLSVGSALALDPMSLHGDAPYLTADDARVVKWRNVLHAQRARLRIGLSWAGNPRHGNDRRRSIALATLAPLLDLDTVAWYSLQRDDGEDQIADVPSARSLRLVDARNDFDDKAALMRSLDLVISVDTSNAHLAGALGVPVWVLLPFAPDWRWGLTGAGTPWYRSARLFRQPATRDWEPVVADVLRALSALDER
ncbi:MAG: DUF5672 family protein [Betaproteobacteria bacterium]